MPGIFGCQTNCLLGKNQNIIPILSLNSNNFVPYNFNNEGYIHYLVDYEHKTKKNAYSTDGCSIIIYGNVYEYNGREVESKNIGKYLLDLYLKEGINILKEINGNFALSIIDKGKTIIASDKMGSKNLFYYLNNKTVIYSSEIKPILENFKHKLQLNKESLLEFFGFSYMLNNKTLYTEIEILPPGTYMIIEDNRFQKVKYFNLESKFTFSNDIDLDIKNLYNTFDGIIKKAIYLRIKNHQKIGLMLSGGLDSRLLAIYTSKIAKKYNKELIFYTFGTKGGWQEKIADEISQKLNHKNYFYEISSESIKNYSEEVVYKGDGHIRIRDAHFISHINQLKEQVDVVLMGIFCSELFGEVLVENVNEFKSKAELIQKLFNIYSVKQKLKYLDKIFQEKYKIKDSLKKLHENFSNSIEQIQLKNPMNIADFWELYQRDRRYILQIPNYVNWYLEVKTPFLDENIIDFAIQLPYELRIRKTFIHQFLEAQYPEFASISYEKTGLSANIFGFKLFESKLKRFIQKRLILLIQKISFGKFKIRSKDYRAYNYLIRTGSKNFVEKALMQEDTIFDSNLIHEIFTKHMRGSDNLDQLICDILNIKLLN
ncbi:hypothetical protein ES705_09829 [subsurface metagenome]